MSEYLPKEVRNALGTATRDAKPARTRWTVRNGHDRFDILRRWETGFALDASDGTHLRGRVDVFDGARHVFQALVVTSCEEDGERVFEYKYATPVTAAAPTPDFVRED